MINKKIIKFILKSYDDFLARVVREPKRNLPVKLVELRGWSWAAGPDEPVEL